MRYGWGEQALSLLFVYAAAYADATTFPTTKQ